MFLPAHHLSFASLPALLATLAVFAAASTLPAQCGLTWQPGAPAAGVNGTVLAVAPLPNGDVIAGGTFGIADAANTNNIARWDGTTWHPLGAGTDNTVNAIVRMPNGDVVAGGTFTAAGGQPANHIARWNGSVWTTLGTGLNGNVHALLVLQNGDLLVGGAFVSAGATVVNRVARWNGSTWSPLGPGFPGNRVNALARLANGDIAAGGDIGTPTSTIYGLQRWDGASWQIIPGFDQFSFSIVEGLATQTNGDLWAIGTMFIGGTTRIARWNGTTLAAFAAPIAPRSVVARANGEVWFGGVEGTSAPSLLRWNGISLGPVAGGPARVRALAEDTNARMVVGAEPITIPKQRAVTRFDGSSWQSLGAPVPPLVTTMVRMPNGDVVIGGAFVSFRGVAANNLARWNGSTWAPLGAGVDGEVRTLAAAPNGELIVAGLFANAGGAPANQVARWNGQAWSTLGGGLPFVPTAIAVSATEEIMATSVGLVRRWDGLAWSTPALAGATVLFGVVALPGGDFVFAGAFSGLGTPMTSVARYSRGVVSSIPGAPAGIGTRLFLADNGDVIVRGIGLSRWNGTTWATLPSILSLAYGELADGDLLTAREAQALGGGAASAVFRFDNGAWQSIGEVLPEAIAVTGSGHGDLFAAGPIETASGQVSMGFAHAVSTCAAVVTVAGSGCTGGAGPVTLAAQNKPWVGGTFRSVATGMTPSSLALQVVGLPAPTQALPGGAPGCSLFVDPLLLDVIVPNAGVAAGEFVVPADPSLAGQLLRVQTIGIELSATSIVRLTGTNALDLTIGAL
jgi:hypothetical protein